MSQSGGGCGTAGFIAPKHTYPTGDGSCSGIAIVRDEGRSLAGEPPLAIERDGE